mgnify:CR=1 FL=1
MTLGRADGFPLVDGLPLSEGESENHGVAYLFFGALGNCRSAALQVADPTEATSVIVSETEAVVYHSFHANQPQRLDASVLYP